jgi:hypothetical protein
MSTSVLVRFSPALLAAVDALIVAHNPPLTRPAAIHPLLE